MERERKADKSGIPAGYPPKDPEKASPDWPGSRLVGVTPEVTK